MKVDADITRSARQFEQRHYQGIEHPRRNIRFQHNRVILAVADYFAHWP